MTEAEKNIIAETLCKHSEDIKELNKEVLKIKDMLYDMRWEFLRKSREN